MCVSAARLLSLIYSKYFVLSELKFIAHNLKSMNTYLMSLTRSIFIHRHEASPNCFGDCLIVMIG